MSHRVFERILHPTGSLVGSACLSIRSDPAADDGGVEQGFATLLCASASTSRCSLRSNVWRKWGFGGALAQPHSLKCIGRPAHPRCRCAWTAGRLAMLIIRKGVFVKLPGYLTSVARCPNRPPLHMHESVCANRSAGNRVCTHQLDLKSGRMTR